MATTGRVLTMAAIAECLTGLALFSVPSPVGRLLLGEDLTGAAVPAARVAGIALVGLGLACWPGPPVLGMIAYGSAVAAYLAYAGLVGEATGFLLWPAVLLHLALAISMWLGLVRG